MLRLASSGSKVSQFERKKGARTAKTLAHFTRIIGAPSNEIHAKDKRFWHSFLAMKGRQISRNHGVPSRIKAFIPHN